MDIRWIFSWFDPDKERQAAESLMEAGASVVVTGADTSGPVQVAGEKGKWGVGYDSRNACSVDTEHCLTVPYWNWGPEYVDMVQAMMDGSFKADDIYFDVDSGSLGLLGFMEGETPAPGVTEDVIPLVTGDAGQDAERRDEPLHDLHRPHQRQQGQRDRAGRSIAHSV